MTRIDRGASDVTVSDWQRMSRERFLGPATGFASPFLAVPSPRDNKGMPIPYAWDAACRRCATLLGRFVFEWPRRIDAHWQPQAAYARTTIPPELAQLEGLHPELRVPWYGLRAKARAGGGQPSRTALSGRAWRDVHGMVVVYCPKRGCERKHVLKPPPQYGPTPVSERWPPFVNSVTGADLLAGPHPPSPAVLGPHAIRLPDRQRAVPRTQKKS